MVDYSQFEINPFLKKEEPLHIFQKYHTILCNYSAK